MPKQLQLFNQDIDEEIAKLLRPKKNCRANKIRISIYILQSYLQNKMKIFINYGLSSITKLKAES